MVDGMKRRTRGNFQAAPLAWWLRCLVVVLACFQVVAPTWHVCAMGASGPATEQSASMPHCACAMPESSPHQATFSNIVADDFCLARLLQHVLGNSQFQLVLDFSSQTIATLTTEDAVMPDTPAFPVRQARAPPVSSIA